MISSPCPESVTIGENVVVEKNVQIGENVQIGHNVLIRSGVRIGAGSIILDGAILGKSPVKAGLSVTTGESRELPLLVLGKSVTVGAYCVIYRGVEVGDRVFFGDLATVRENVSIGELTIIGRGVTVENKTTIGKRCKIESNAYITAVSLVEDYCFVAPCAAFSNDNYLGRTEERKKHFAGPILRRGARIGVNATLLPGVEIGPDALVAAGAVVTRDVPARTVVIGCPAKEMKPVPEEQLIENQTFYEG
ncbi:MAG: UDP-3-O-(3-hydroxymyristoyl)glucosamine N-acyltransferase [Dethiosulfovibrio peptidovorans]|nr:MAG: UDP-3-O-(3-hydroxymyristoyl)glucosamine N-acyltransferase [Dethiosulfovibrio peptidovorans]